MALQTSCSVRSSSGTHLEVQVHVREAKPPRTTILRGDTIVKLRPDLVVAAVDAPPQTLTTRPIDVVADIAEVNGETGATATLTLMLGPIASGWTRSRVTVPAGGSLTVDVRRRRKLEHGNVGRADGASWADAAPAETDVGNNTLRAGTVE